jgi:hypothetical protein
MANALERDDPADRHGTSNTGDASALVLRLPLRTLLHCERRLRTEPNVVALCVIVLVGSISISLSASVALWCTACMGLPAVGVSGLYRAGSFVLWHVFGKEATLDSCDVVNAP